MPAACAARSASLLWSPEVGPGAQASVTASGAGEAPHVVPLGAQGALDVVEVDPVPENLRDARPAAGDLEQTGIRDAAEVTGVQALDGSPQREVGGAVGVAEHDVRPAVDDLAVDDLEGPAGHGHADRGGVLGGEVGGQVGHPRGRLGLAVHDEQVEAPLAPEGGQLDDTVRVHPAAGLRDGAQVREVHRGETDAVEQLEGVGDPGQGGHAAFACERPEALVGHREVGEHDRRPDEQVAVHDAQAVAVVQRQAGERLGRSRGCRGPRRSPRRCCAGSRGRAAPGGASRSSRSCS
jgi:hypothetical protein